jgi:PAS domain S-box-containing protein
LGNTQKARRTNGTFGFTDTKFSAKKTNRAIFANAMTNNKTKEMDNKPYIDHLIDQTNDLIWMVNHQLQLVYANKSYLNLMKELTGTEKELNTPVLVDGFGQSYIEKWKGYYERAFSGDIFTVEEHFFHPVSKERQYGHISFTPITNSEGEFLTVACSSTDITWLMNQKNKASQLMDASLDVFCTINEKGNFTYVSSQSESLWGYKPEELIDIPYANLIIEEDVPKTNEIASKIMSGQNVRTFTNRYKRKDGEIAYNIWSARWDDDAKMMYCVVRDGKELVKKEGVISQSEQRFKALVAEGGDLIAILNTEGLYTYVSPTSTSVLGMEPEEFIGRSPFDLIHPEDCERVQHSLEKIFTNKKVTVEPFRFKNSQNQWRWIETVLTNMIDNPAVNGVVANSRDVTEKVEENHHLILLQSVITNTKDAVLITDAEPFDEPGPRIIYVNKAFTEMTGYTAEEVIGKTPRILQGSNSNYEELARLGKAMRNWETCEITTINYKKNGEEFWINFTVTPVADETGRYTHWIAIERDVTAQKNAELEKDLLTQIATCFQERELPQAGKALCEVIQDFADFDLVELWCPNLEQSQLLQIGYETSLSQFKEANNTIRIMAKDEGLPGRVWETGEQLLWGQNEISKNFLRKNEAESARLNYLLGVPLTHLNQITGVLVIGTKKKDGYLHKFSGLLRNSEIFTGSEINRKRLEDDLRHLYDSVPEVLCIADFEGRFLKINPAGCELLGYTEEEILFHSFDDFIHPEDRDISSDELNKLKQGVTTFQFETRYITKDREIIWLSWSCNSSVKDRLIYAAAKDITNEKKLRQLNKQANTMAKIGSWEVDVEKGQVFWSEMVHRMHETDPDTYVPDLESAIKFYREDYREMVAKSVGQAIQTGGSIDFEAVIITQNLKERWVKAIGDTEVVDGITKRFFGSFQDITESKTTEIRLKSLSDDLPGVTFQFRVLPEGKSSGHLISKAAHKIWGVSPEELEQDIDIVWDQIKKGGDFEKVQESIEKSISSGDKWNFRWRNILPNGEVRWHEGLGTPNVLPDGTIIFNSMIFDVTEEQKSKEQILEANERFEKVTEATNDAIWDWDIVNGTFYRSQNIRKFFGKETATILNRQDFWNDAFHPDDLKTIQESISKALKNKQTKRWEMEYRIFNAEGNTIYVLDKGLIIRDSAGKATRMIGAMTDITELKSANIELTRQAEFINTMTDHQLAAIVACNADGELTLFNKTAKEWHGVDAMNVAQEKWAEFYDLYRKDGIDLLDKSEIPLIKALNEEKVRNDEIIIKKKNENSRIVICNGASFYDKKSQKLGAVVVMTDITERKQNEQQLLTINNKLKIQTKELQRSNEELEQFAFVTSHDLQEPLRMISGFMDQLDRKYADQLDYKANQYIQFARDGAKRMKQIILDLLLYSRVNRPMEAEEAVNLNEIVSEFLLSRRKIIAEKKAKINYDQLPVLKTHRAPITQLFHSLLDNALKYTKEHVTPLIEIKVVDKEYYLEFSIKDNGIGIDEQFYEKVFIIFQRLHNRNDYGGTGIGLSVAKRAVEFLSGEIWLESTLGEGSTFYFTIKRTL